MARWKSAPPIPSPFTSGGISVDMATVGTPYTFGVDNVTVTTLPAVANNDSYSVPEDTTLTVEAPGVLGNDVGSGLTAVQVGGPTNGVLTLNPDGSFSYTPNNGFLGMDTFTYEASNGQTNSNVATVSITVTPNPVVANNQSFSTFENSILTVGAPGVLTNDSGGSGNLTALLVSGPANGVLTLNGDGSFAYTTTNNFVGVDSFNYEATDGSITSGVATVAIDVTPPGEQFYDNFTRSGPGSNSLLPWIVFNGVGVNGTWAITNGVLTGQSVDGDYGYIYINNPNWTDYSVQGQIQFSTTDAWGGGIGGRLDPTTGAHYAAWVYPDSAGGGPNVTLWKFSDWTTPTLMQTVTLPPAGTTVHTVELTFQGANLNVYFDNTLEISTTDSTSPFTSGGISVDMATIGSSYTFGVSNVTVTSLLTGQTINFGALSSQTYGNAPLTVSATASSGLPVSLNILSGPATISGNTITITGAGTVTVQASQAGNTTYQAATNVDQSFTVFPAGLTVSGVTAQDKVYDGTTNATLSGTATLNGVVNGDDVSLVTGAVTAAFADPDTGTDLPVTVSGYAITGADAGNYTLTQPAGLTANITAATLTYTATPAGMTYGTAVPALSGSVSGFVGTDTQGSATTGTLTFTTMATSSSGAASYAINGSGLTANNGNYTFVQAAGNATALTIGALPVNLTGTRPYDGTTAVAAGILSVGNKAGSDDVTVASGSGTLAGAAVGSEAITSFGTLTLGGASAGNYTLSGASGSVGITASGLAVTNLLALDKVYDGTTNATLDATNAGLAGVLNGDSVTLVSSNAAAYFADKNVGTNKPVTVTGLALGGVGATNYSLVTPTNVTASITPAGLTVSGVTVQDKVYDGTTNATLSGTATLNGVVNGDDVSLVTGAVTAAFADPDTGTDLPVTVSGYAITGADAGNYTLTQPAGLTANITAATLTYTATPAGMTYGTAVPALSGSVSGFVGTDTQGSATTGTLTFTTMATSSSGAASYAINGSGLTANNGNYTFVQAAGNATALTIGALPVNLTGTRPYDGTAAVAAGILSVGNKVGSDDVTVASGSGTLAGAAVASEAITSFGTLTLGGASAGNYTLSGASGLVSITASGLAVTNLLALDKVYDGTTNATLDATNAGLAGVLNGDSVTLVSSNAAAYFADKNVGTNKPVTVTGLALGGVGATNYSLVTPTNVTASITPAGLTASGVTAQDKVYDGTTNATLSGTATLNGQVSGDDVSLVTGAVTAAFADPDTGTDLPVTVSGYALTGADAGNYTLTQPAGLTADILPLVTPVFSSTAISMGSGGWQLSFSAQAGQSYRVLVTGDLTLPFNQWTVLTNGTFGAGTVTVTDNSTNLPNRFYLIVSP